MIEGLPWPAWLGIAGTGWGLAAVAVIALIRGRVVPRSALDDTLHDRDEWRTESRIKDQQILEKDEQLRHLSEVGETMKSVLGAVQSLRRKGGLP